jgi:DNA invertase Pin-like site-specific DNA recombinase
MGGHRTVKRVIELIRVSTAKQAEDDRFSIPAQKAVCSKIASQYGLKIEESIAITDVGGSDILLAPEMQLLLSKIKSPDIHGVVAREFSRLMRPENMEDFAILQKFAETKTLLYLPDGPIDFASKGGRLMGGIRALLAGMEKSEFLERSFTAREEMRKQGKLASASFTLPFGVGYDKPDEKGGAPRWYYKPEAEKVRRCFELVCQGVTKYADLEAAVGLTRWNIRGILSNPIYTGWRVIDKKRDPSPAGKYVRPDGRQAGRRKICRESDEVIRVKVIDHPLVSDEMFQHAKAILDAKARGHYRNREGYTPAWQLYVYKGFLFCDLCESPYYTCSTKQDGVRFDYYKCRNRMPQSRIPIDQRCKAEGLRREKLEDLLDNLFARQLTRKAFLKELVLRMEKNAEAKSSKSRVARLRAEIRQLQDRRARVLDMFEMGDIDRDAKTARLEKIERELATAQRELMETAPVESLLDPVKLLELFAPFVEWDIMDVQTKRLILTSLSPEIRAHNYQVSGISILGVSTLSDAPEGGSALAARGYHHPMPRQVRDRLNTSRLGLSDYVIHHKMAC